MKRALMRALGVSLLAGFGFVQPAHADFKMQSAADCVTANARSFFYFGHYYNQDPSSTASVSCPVEEGTAFSVTSVTNLWLMAGGGPANNPIRATACSIVAGAGGSCGLETKAPATMSWFTIADLSKWKNVAGLAFRFITVYQSPGSLFQGYYLSY